MGPRAGGELPEHPSYEQYLSARILAGLPVERLDETRFSDDEDPPLDPIDDDEDPS